MQNRGRIYSLAAFPRSGEMPHFLEISQVCPFSQVIKPQVETPICYANRNFFPKIIPLTTAKTVASPKFLGKV
jgi:hypothetical protein